MLDGVNIVGEVKNIGPDTLKYVQVIGTFYKDAEVIDTVSGYTSLDELAPGQTSTVYS